MSLKNIIRLGINDGKTRLDITSYGTIIIALLLLAERFNLARVNLKAVAFGINPFVTWELLAGIFLLWVGISLYYRL